MKTESYYITHLKYNIIIITCSNVTLTPPLPPPLQLQVPKQLKSGLVKVVKIDANIKPILRIGVLSRW